MLVPKEELKDVSDIFICVYNNKHVGLFKKINWSSEKRYENLIHDYAIYNAGSVYVGVDSNYVGMKKTHTYDECENHWEPIGKQVIIENETYVSNCNMQNGMSFDDMRLIMYSEGEISAYQLGKASSKEMVDVLKYAASYYQLDKKAQKQKRK